MCANILLDYPFKQESNSRWVGRKNCPSEVKFGVVSKMW